LFDRHAAIDLADSRAVQPRRLSDQRLSLELLRKGRCGSWREPRHDDGLPRGVSRSRGVEFQDGIPTDGLTIGDHRAAARTTPPALTLFSVTQFPAVVDDRELDAGRAAARMRR